MAVVLHRINDEWEIHNSAIEPFTGETEILPAFSKVLAQLPGGCKVALVIPETVYQWVQIEKPNLPEQEIVSALHWAIKELVNYEPSEIIADFYDLTLKQGDQAKINVVVTNRTLLLPFLNLLHDSEIALELVTTAEMAICDMVIQDDGAHMVISQQVGCEPSLHIICNGELLLSRKLRGLTPLAQQPLNQLKLGLLDVFGLELQRSLDFFESQLKQPPIKSLQLAIPNLELNGIAQELSEFFPAKVLALEPCLPLCQQQNAEMQFAIATALSLDA